MRHSYHRFIPRKPLHRTGFPGLGGGSGSTLLTLGLVGLGGYALYRVLSGRSAGHHLVGAGPDCGPNAFWDDTQKSCVPLNFQPPPTTPPPACPPGMFYDYFKKTCILGAPSTAPTTTSGYYAGWGFDHHDHHDDFHHGHGDQHDPFRHIF